LLQFHEIFSTALNGGYLFPSRLSRFNPERNLLYTLTGVFWVPQPISTPRRSESFLISSRNHRLVRSAFTMLTELSQPIGVITVLFVSTWYEMLFKMATQLLIRSQDGVVGIETGYGLDDRRGRSSSSCMVKNILFSMSSRPVLRPTQSPI
jgi:hypothetical protein